jgi:hypothetical protein
MDVNFLKTTPNYPGKLILKENKRMKLGAFQHMNVRDVEALWRGVTFTRYAFFPF